MIVNLPDLAATGAFGARIAAALQPGDVVALTGGLGAGKTTLARTILTALGHTGEVPSPTFAIFEVYDAPTLRVPTVHADFYRLNDPAEAAELGIDDYRGHSALLAEWPDHAGGFGHEPGCLGVMLENPGEGDENARRAIVSAGADWLKRGAWK